MGVARWPVKDHNHHTTTDMWLYRAYSGNLYHGGELVRTLPSFTQGDTITCILDMEAHTISFAKNDKVGPDTCPLHWTHVQSDSLIPYASPACVLVPGAEVGF